MNTNCFLCNAAIPQTSTDDRDTYTYKCPTCGYVKITEEAVIGFSGHLKGINYLLSGFTRERTESGQRPVVILSTNALQLANGPQVPKNVTEKLDHILLYLEKKSNFAGQAVPLDIETAYPIAYAKNSKEFRFLVDQLIAQKLIEMYSDRKSFALTMDGWIRVDQLHRTLPTTNQAFVAMWFTSETESAYKDGIHRAIVDCNFSPVRVDLIHYNDKIDDRIVAEIRKSKFLVADFTGHRGGVYFEAGFALGLGLPVIWTCRKDSIEAAHFDTRQYNHVVWESPEELYTKLKDRIEATIIK